MVLFISKDNADVLQAVKDTLNHCVEIELFDINTEEDALAVAAEAQSQDRGVFVLKERFARGYDCRF